MLMMNDDDEVMMLFSEMLLYLEYL